MKYRSRTDIIAMILRAATNGGATKTKLMYSAYLSYTQLKEYLQFLLEKNLLSYEPGSQLYKLNQKGLRFLGVYEEISELVTLGGKSKEQGLRGSTE